MMISMITVFGNVALAAPALGAPTVSWAGDEITFAFAAEEAVGLFASLRALQRDDPAAEPAFIDQYILANGDNNIKFPIDAVALKGKVLTVTLASLAGTISGQVAVDVNKSVLQAAYDAAPTNASIYYAPTWVPFAAAYAAAGDVLAAISSQAQVDAALAALQDALDGLLFLVTSLKIDAPAATTVVRGGTYLFEAIAGPTPCFLDLEWKINNPAYAIVNANGTITILNKTGTVQLTAVDKETGISVFIVLRIV